VPAISPFWHTRIAQAALPFDVTMAQRPHQHVAKQVHVVVQRGGVPYEVERQVCAGCSHVLVERPLKRAAA
jgi:hypothetical protein